jgi:hypothetical protein
VGFYFSELPQEELGYLGGACLEAGRTLMRSLRRRRGFRAAAMVPVLSLYSHAIELFLKAIVIAAERPRDASTAEDKTLFESLKTHRLSRLLPRVEAAFKRVGWEWWWPRHPSVETLDHVRKLLRRIENLGGRSSAFRYPVDTDGQRAFTLEQFHLEATVSALDALAEALDTALFGLAANRS